MRPSPRASTWRTSAWNTGEREHVALAKGGVDEGDEQEGAEDGVRPDVARARFEVVEHGGLASGGDLSHSDESDHGYHGGCAGGRNEETDACASRCDGEPGDGGRDDAGARPREGYEGDGGTG